VSQDHGLALPLNFSSPLDELNFISILSLLNFGSAYRVPLHEQTKRGAWDSMRALMFSLYISSGDGDLLSARGMTTLSVAKIAELMGISLHVERPHEKLPGITVGELGGPLYELVGMISLVLKETGEILRKSGYQNLGAFVAEALKSTENLPADQRADVIVERVSWADASSLKATLTSSFSWSKLSLVSATCLMFWIHVCDRENKLSYKTNTSF